ncbi:hypothetical protein [Streptomyces koyangensis]
MSARAGAQSLTRSPRNASVPGSPVRRTSLSGRACVPSRPQRPRPPPARRKLSRLALRRAVLSLAATAGPALLVVLEWWLHEG